MKNILLIILLVFIQVIVSAQTNSKLDMFGPSGLSVTYDKNIIVNGDFTAEYSGWSFDQGSGGYHIKYSGNSYPGDIQVGTNPLAFNKGIYAFDSYGDHTTGTGNFLMVDGKCKATYIKLWKQTVQIQPNTYYLFSIWISSLKDNPSHPGVLILNIGGQSIDLNIIAPYKGGATAATDGGGWVNFEKIWFSNTMSGNILISIENNNNETCDTEVDFGIDDIELKPVHKESAPLKMPVILFETGSTIIEPSYFNSLDTIAKDLIQHPAFILSLEGHTDNIDNNTANIDLSRQRAFAVRNYLTAKGVHAARIYMDGFGEFRPVSTNETAEGRKKNRRVEMHIIQ